MAIRQYVRQIIGRSASTLTVRFWSVFGKSLDRTKVDYAFWDKFRRCKQVGFEMAGIFAKPITEIVTSYVIGRSFKVALSQSADTAAEFTNDLLGRFVGQVHGTLLNMVLDLYGLGDQYIVINQADGSLSIPSPETVDYLYDEVDYRTPLGCVITTRLDRALITDEYRADGRTVTIKNTGKMTLMLQNGDTVLPNSTVVLRYANLIGRIPVVHFPNDRSNNETHGRPIYEGLLRVFMRYDDLIEKMIDGAELLGNPMPVFEGMEDVQGTIDTHKTDDDEEYADEQGNILERVKIAFDRLPALFIGKGGSFKFAAPNTGFTDDIRNVLKLLFLLILDYTRIPEVIWGNELSSARASAEEQLKVFQMYIEGRRTMLEGQGSDEVLGRAQGGLLELIDIWLRVQQLIHGPKVVIAPVNITWPQLSEIDSELTLKWTEFLRRIGAISKAKSVDLANITEDPQAVVDDAADEAAKAEDPFEKAVDDELAA